MRLLIRYHSNQFCIPYCRNKFPLFLRNDRSIILVFNQIRHIAAEQPNGYRRVFFPEVPTCDVLLFPSSPGCYSPTAPSAPFLRPFVPSGSLMRCETIQGATPIPLCGGKTSESRRCPHAQPSPALKPVIKSLSFSKGGGGESSKANRRSVPIVRYEIRILVSALSSSR
jgi:hypothetical protein